MEAQPSVHDGALLVAVNRKWHRADAASPDDIVRILDALGPDAYTAKVIQHAEGFAVIYFSEWEVAWEQAGPLSKAQ
jgi:hypothetical protein